MSDKLSLLRAEEAIRLDLLLVQEWPGLNRATLRGLIQDGHVLINGEQALKAGQYLKGGDRVEVEFTLPEAVARQESTTASLDIVYEDASVLVLDKPAGQPVHSSRHVSTGTLAALLSQAYPEMAHVGGVERAGILQRLDTECSGLVVAARTEQAYRFLKREVTRQRAIGEYVALVEGRLTGSGDIEAPIGNMKHERQQLAVTREGRAAFTHYHAVHHYNSEGRYYSLLEVQPESARLHQIRVHLAWYGYPVVGDKVYGTARQPEWVTRVYLHLSGLSFPHPESGVVVAFESPIPADIYGVLHYMTRRKQTRD